MFIFIFDKAVIIPLTNAIYIPLCLYLYIAENNKRSVSNNLHSTMFIFIFKPGKPTIPQNFHLHSTMFIFICSGTHSPLRLFLDLHSTMFIFIFILGLFCAFLFSNLHSTMFIFIYESRRKSELDKLIYIPLCLYLYEASD